MSSRFFLTTFGIAGEAVDICKGSGDWGFGTNAPGRVDDEKAPFILGNPPGTCALKPGEKEKIVKGVLAESSGTAEKKIAVFLMGAPGCGKSSSLARVLNQLGHQKEEFVNIDVDDIRSKIADFHDNLTIPSKLCPGKLRAYTGLMAWCKSAGAEVRNAIFKKVLDEKRSFIFDGTCRSPDFCKRAIDDSINAGFTPYLVAVWAKGKTCADRSIGRASQTGRRVGPSVALTAHKGIHDDDVFNTLADIVIEAGGEAWIFNNEGQTPVQAFHRSGTQCVGINKEACEYYRVP